MRYFIKNNTKARTEINEQAEKLLASGWTEVSETEWNNTVIPAPEQPTNTIEERVATLETDVSDLTAAVERGLSL